MFLRTGHLLLRDSTCLSCGATGPEPPEKARGAGQDEGKSAQAGVPGEGCLDEVDLQLDVRGQAGPWEQKKGPQEGREWRPRGQTTEEVVQRGGARRGGADNGV